MSLLDYRTAGESHGPALMALVEGLPAGLALVESAIDDALRRRQGGYGRGGRMAIERDHVRIFSGIRRGETTGSPLTLVIENRDNRLNDTPPITRPRPGHADFAGAMKWLTTDCRNTLERASARETAARVAAGAVAVQLLRVFGIEVAGFVTRIGSTSVDIDANISIDSLRSARDASDVYCPDAGASDKMIDSIRLAKEEKDALGGVVEVRATGLPPGLGSCARWQDKLDGRLMQAIGSVQAIKGVEIGQGFASAELRGSDVHDEFNAIAADRSGPSLGFSRATNRAGGLEGGMTNGMPLIVRAAMKPISTLVRGLQSMNLATLKSERSDYERSDICSVPAASVVVEHVVAFELARAMCEKFAGDTLGEMRAAHEHYLNAAQNLSGVVADT